MRTLLITLLTAGITSVALAQVQFDEYGIPIPLSTPTPTPAPTRSIPFEEMPLELRDFVYHSLPLAPVKDMVLPAGGKIIFQTADNLNQLEAAIVEAIDSAQMEILFNTRAITSQVIAQALVQAKLNGRIVAGIMEEKPEGVSRYNAPSYFMINNLPIYFDKTPGQNTNNYLVIDRKKVLVSSLDFTRGGNQENAGNIFVIEDPAVAIAYYNGWVNHLATTAVPAKTQSVLRTLTQ